MKPVRKRERGPYPENSIIVVSFPARREKNFTISRNTSSSLLFSLNAELEFKILMKFHFSRNNLTGIILSLR